MHTRTPGRAALLAASLLALLAPAVSAPAAPPEITGLAPARSVFVVSVPNFKTLSDAFLSTPLGKLFDEPSVKAFLEEATEEQSKGLAEMLKSVDADLKDLHPPQGQVGLAIFFDAKSDEKPDGAKARAHSDPHALVTADMGEHTDEYDKLLERIFDKNVQAKTITVDHDTYSDVPVTVIHPVVDEAAEKREKARREKANRGEEDEDAEENPRQDNPFAYWIGGSDGEHRAGRIAHVGTVFVASTDQRAFEDAVDALKGKSIESFADAPSVHDSLDQHPAGSLATVLFNIRGALDQIKREQGESPGGPNFDKMLDAWGINGVRTASAALRMDSPDAMVDISVAALAPEKKGLLALISTPVGAFEPPAFVPADAAGVTRLSFDFPKLFEVVRSFLSALPEETRAQAAGPVEIARDMTQQGLLQMGPAVHIVNTIAQPLSAESSRSTFAIDLKDQEAVSNTLAGIVAKAPGMVEPSEFEGNQIYKSEAMGGLAAGIGFNHLFIGTEQAVQGAMRLAGRNDSATLAQNPRFKEATSALAPGAIAYSWADMEQELRLQYWALQNEAVVLDQQLAAAGVEAEQRAEYVKRYSKNQPEWIAKLPPIETVVSHVGDTVSEVRATPDGFRGRVLMLRPSEKK